VLTPDTPIVFADMDIERSLKRESSDHIHEQLQLLAHSSIPLVEAVTNALKHGSDWAKRINADRSFFSRGNSSRGKEFEEENKRISETLGREIEEYKTRGRLEVLDPYKVSSHPALYLLFWNRLHVHEGRTRD